MNISLGEYVIDKISGLRGCAVAEVKYLSGLKQFLIQPVSDQGEYKEGQWIDEHRVKVDENAPYASEVMGK